MKYSLCTLSDYNYLSFGLALYDSLMEHTSEEFDLHYLAMDDETEAKLIDLNLKNVIVHSLREFECDDKYIELKNKNEKNPESDLGHSPFHYMMSSFFSDYLLNKKNLPHIFYIDSDIYFCGNFASVYNSVTDHSIGLITHKHIQLDKTTRNPGYYNVGVVYFSGDDVGKGCLRFWKECCVNPDNEYSKIFGACGDQKYLELFGDKFGEENIQNICLKVGNGAPWNLHMFDYLENNKILWKDPNGIVIRGGGFLEQDLIFVHFSHFTPDYESLSYRMDWNGEWGPWIRQIPEVQKLYSNYFNKLILTREKYSL